MRKAFVRSVTSVWVTEIGVAAIAPSPCSLADARHEGEKNSPYRQQVVDPAQENHHNGARRFGVLQKFHEKHHHQHLFTNNWD